MFHPSEKATPATSLRAYLSTYPPTYIPAYLFFLASYEASNLPICIHCLRSSTEMSDYREWQARYEDLDAEAWENQALADDDPDKWDIAQERRHAENMLLALGWERRGRQEALEEMGDDADDERIEEIEVLERQLYNKIANLGGGYRYDGVEEYGEGEEEEVVEVGEVEVERDDGVEVEEVEEEYEEGYEYREYRE